MPLQQEAWRCLIFELEKCARPSFQKLLKAFLMSWRYSMQLTNMFYTTTVVGRQSEHSEEGMGTTTDGRSVVLGMGDGSMTTLTIADPDKAGISDFLKSLPSRNPEKADGIRTSRASSVYLQNGVEYPSPYDYSIYTDYLKALQQCIPPAHNTTNETES